MREGGGSANCEGRTLRECERAGERYRAAVVAGCEKPYAQRGTGFAGFRPPPGNRAYSECKEEDSEEIAALFGLRSGRVSPRPRLYHAAKEVSHLASDNCIFCNTKGEKLVVENALAQAVYDTYPVSPGHVLIVPRRHAAMIWDLSSEEYAACFELVRQAKAIIEARHNPDAFNVGANCGEAAGQSVWHAHIHLIPRYRGDVANPRGGVRNVVPHKAHYERKERRP